MFLFLDCCFTLEYLWNKNLNYNEKKSYYISESLPNSFSGGTAQLGINLLRELKKKYNVIAVNSLSNFYASKDRFIKAKNELKRKIKYFHLKKY